MMIKQEKQLQSGIRMQPEFLKVVVAFIFTLPVTSLQDLILHG